MSDYIRLVTPYRRDPSSVAPTPTELQEKIIRIIEVRYMSKIVQIKINSELVWSIKFYLGDQHLPFDKFIKSQMGYGGWIETHCFLKYSTLQLLTNNPEVIAEALKQSSSGLVQVSRDGTMIRRSPDRPLPILNEEWYRINKERSVLCSGFPTKATVDYEKMWNFFQANYPTPVHIKVIPIMCSY